MAATATSVLTIVKQESELDEPKVSATEEPTEDTNDEPKIDATEEEPLEDTNNEPKVTATEEAEDPNEDATEDVADDMSEISNKRQRVVAGSVFQFKVHGMNSGVLQFAVHESASLLTLVASAFKFGLERELDESMDSHLWCIGPSPDRMYSSGEPQDDEDDDPASRVFLNHLKLSTGDTLTLAYDFGATQHFKFIVADIVPAREPSDLSPRDLGYEPVSYDGPIVTAAEAAVGAAFRNKFEAYLAGDNLWSWHQCKYIKPTAPDWGGSTQSDSVVIECLLEAGMGFAKAWKELLEPCLLLRTKSSASMFWYKTKKQISSYGSSWVARFYPEPSPREYLRKARTLLRIRREQSLKYPCEKKPPVLDRNQLEVVQTIWERDNVRRILSGGRASSEDDYKLVEAEFRKVPMAEKIEIYKDLRRRRL